MARSSPEGILPRKQQDSVILRAFLMRLQVNGENRELSQFVIFRVEKGFFSSVE
jgi:hypothetical protein